MFKKNIFLNPKKWILYYAMSKKTDKFDRYQIWIKSTKPNHCNDGLFESKLNGSDLFCKPWFGSSLVGIKFISFFQTNHNESIWLNYVYLSM